MTEEERQIFEEIALKELDACGYFMARDKLKDITMDKIIMDFTCLYCKEYYNKNYTYNEEKNI